MQFCLKLVLGVPVLAAAAVAVSAAENAPVEAHKVASPRVVSVVRADARTGRLVRSVVVASKPSPAKVAGKQAAGNEVGPPSADSPMRAMAQETAKTLDVNPFLVDSVIQVESNYNPFAVSPKGAQGLMQLMPATARRFGVKDSFDARQNIEGGVKYLKFLQDMFKDDRLALAAYNAGERAVTKYGNVPPYPETVNYVAKVGKKYGQAKKTAAELAPVPAKPVEKPKPEENEPRHIKGYLDQEGRLHIETR